MPSTLTNFFQDLASVNDYFDGVKILKNLHFDAIHLDSNAVKSIGWESIHAENDGHLEDDEKMVLAKHFNRVRSTEFYATTLELIQKAEERGSFRSLVLKKIDVQALTALQEGIISATQPAAPEDANLSADITFYASTSFDRPLSFVILREAEGYGWTTIAGMPSLINAIKSRSRHGLYRWRDGVLPLHIAGACDPNRK